MGGNTVFAVQSADVRILVSFANSCHENPKSESTPVRCSNPSMMRSLGHCIGLMPRARSGQWSGITGQGHVRRTSLSNFNEHPAYSPSRKNQEECLQISRCLSRFGQGQMRSAGIGFPKQSESASRSRRARRRHAVAETDAEREGWEKRKKEAGEKGHSIGGWQWTLNWDGVTPTLMIGSCPRSAGDIDRLVDEAGVTAILNLQSDLCVDALQIPVGEIRAQAVERGVFWARVPIRDFDKGDQALMLPEAVRMLNVLLSRGHRVYCHCTAGINRASLSVLGYLTFVQGMSLDEGLVVVKTARPQAHPYLECWHEVERRLLDGRQEELTALAVEIYQNRCSDGSPGDAQSDWNGARTRAAARSFERWLEVEQHALNMQHDLLQASTGRQLAVVQDQLAKAHSALDAVRLQVANSRASTEAQEIRLSSSEAELARTKAVLDDLLGQVAAFERAAAAAASAAEAKADAAVAAEKAAAASAAAATAAAATGADEAEALAKAESESKAIRDAAKAEAAAAEALLSELESVISPSLASESSTGSITSDNRSSAEFREITALSTPSSSPFEGEKAAGGAVTGGDEVLAGSSDSEGEEADIAGADLECNVITRECSSSDEDQPKEGEETSSPTYGVASSAGGAGASVAEQNGSAVPSPKVPTAAGLTP